MSARGGFKEVSVSVDVRWLEKHVVEARIRGFKILMDTPPFERKRGEGRGPSATETLLAALGRCVLISVLRAARELKLEFSELKCRVEGKLKEVEPTIWRFSEISVNLEGRGSSELRGRVKDLLRLAEKYCIVGNLIEEGLPLKINLAIK